MIEFTFPVTPENAKDWRPATTYRGLGGTNSMRGAVLAAANTRIEGTWKAYILVVPGENFDREYKQVLDEGSPLDEDVARAIFPIFGDLPYSRG